MSTDFDLTGVHLFKCIFKLGYRATLIRHWICTEHYA